MGNFRRKHAGSTRLGTLAVLVAARLCSTANPAPDSESYAKARAAFEEHCYSCHSHQAAKIKGGLVVDSLSGLLHGGDSGPAIVPGNPDASLLVRAIRYGDENLQMPPKGKKLSPESVESIVAWIAAGAVWPQAAAAAVRQPGFTDADRAWWAIQPLRPQPPPSVAHPRWGRNEVDLFIAAKLEARGLSPAPEAERPTLLRRLAWDVTGLPPTAASLDEFASDPDPNAYDHWVDRLLASPHYGERWARHWLDLVRYAESDGYKADDYRPQAWRYRDYVIRSLNEDKPYDRFVLEQLAGDELWPEDPEARVATSFLRHGIYEYNNRDARGQWQTILNDLTDTAGDVFLGLGMGCARCHDHKFDPILQKDYYRLQAFFAPILPRDDLPLASPSESAAYQRDLQPWLAATAELRARIDAIEKPHRERAAAAAIQKFPEDVQELILKPVHQRTPYEHQIAELAYRQVSYEHDRIQTRIKGDERIEWERLRKELAAFDGLKPPPPPPAFAATDLGREAPPTFIPRHAGEPIEPGFLSLLDPRPARIEPLPPGVNSTGRRAALARWIVNPTNALTARVIVNRIWQQHFGAGLVRTPSDFGRLGESPSHPELLDYLAHRFVAEGWSLKKLHRLILTSATYRQSAAVAPGSLTQQRDPENRLLWRMNSRRLDAEQIRDAIFTATGELRQEMGGPSTEFARPRRSIYSKVLRNTHDPILEAFDAPESFVSSAQRDVTTTPTQALLMMNNPFLLQKGAAFAHRLIAAHGDDPRRAIAEAYRMAFARSPTAAELTGAEAFIRAQQRLIEATQPPPMPLPFTSDRMPYREGRAAVLQPASVQNKFETDSPLPTLDTGFTIEAFVLLKSMPPSAPLRVIASQWNANPADPGWALVVTGQQHPSHPRALALVLSGSQDEAVAGYQTLASDLQLELNRPYFVAAATRIDERGAADTAFYLKDLTNDDEPMLSSRHSHAVTRAAKPAPPLVIGGRTGDARFSWEGLIDDVRISSVALAADQLLLNHETAVRSTLGFWRFDSIVNYHKDSSPQGHDLKLKYAPAASRPDSRTAAWIDFCHVLLNASEFIYVD